MPLDHYVTLGRSGLRVSPFCLGTMTFGEEWGWGSSVADSEAILARYLDAGGNFIDTANLYTWGHSEKIIGDFFKKNPARREKAVIATKFFGSLTTGDPNAGGAGRKSLITACEHSLRRLQTDTIDLYWMHCWDKFTPIEETMRALDDLVTQGKVRYIGFSDTPAWKTMQAQMTAHFRGWAPLAALQVEYNLLQRTVEGEIIPMAQELGLGVTPWSPLAAGTLTGKYSRQNHGKHTAGRGEWATSRLSEKAYDIVDALEAIAREIGSTPARVALAWVQSQPGITSTIIGARTMKQLEENLAALELTLTPKHNELLRDLSKPVLPFPTEFVANAAGFRSSGTTINGETAPVNPIAPPSDAKRY